MKRKYLLLSVILFTVNLLTLVSCSKEDDIDEGLLPKNSVVELSEEEGLALKIESLGSYAIS